MKDIQSGVNVLNVKMQSHLIYKGIRGYRSSADIEI